MPMPRVRDIEHTLIDKCSVPGCTLLSNFRNLKLCLPHYHHQKYLERRARAVQTDPAEATADISACLKKFTRLRDAGYLHQLRFAALQHEFLSMYKHALAVVEDDYDTQEMAEADEEYVKLRITSGAVQAESDEEAKQLFAERDKPKLGTGEKPVEDEEPTKGPQLTEPFRLPVKKQNEKQRFVTGQKPAAEPVKPLEDTTDKD